MAEADPTFSAAVLADSAARASQKPKGKTWTEHMEDGRAWARGLRAGSSANINDYAVERTAFEYADMHASPAAKAAHFAAAKAARDAEFGRC